MKNVFSYTAWLLVSLYGIVERKWIYDDKRKTIRAAMPNDE